MGRKPDSCLRVLAGKVLQGEGEKILVIEVGGGKEVCDTLS